MATPPRSFPEQRAQSHMELVTRKLPVSGASPVFLHKALEEPETLLILGNEGDEERTDPRAEGACLFDLSVAEWRLVRNAPLTGFLLVAGADGTVHPRERRALVEALGEGKHSPCELFQAVCRDLYRRRATLLELFASDTFEREQLSEAYRLVSGKLGQDEAERFKACLLELGWRVARASGGLLASWGWVRGVERRALNALSEALNDGR